MIARRAALAAPVLALQLIAGPVLAASPPTALWHFDEESGTTAADATGHGYGATMSNITKGVPGLVNTAFAFDGSSSRLIVKDASGLDPKTNDFTITVSVKFTAVPASGEDYDLVRKGLSSSTGTYWKMEIIRSSGTARAFCVWKGSAGYRSKTGSANLADGRWHTISCEKAATSVALVVDGARSKSTFTVGSIDNSADLSIGAKAGSGGGDWYPGVMDEVSYTIEP